MPYAQLLVAWSCITERKVLVEPNLDVNARKLNAEVSKRIFSFQKRRSLLKSKFLDTCCQASSKIAQPWKITTGNARPRKQQDVIKDDLCRFIQRNLQTVQLIIEFSAAPCQSIRWLNSTVQSSIFRGGETRSLSLYLAREKTSIYFISLKNSLSKWSECAT